MVFEKSSLPALFVPVPDLEAAASFSYYSSRLSFW
jgi:hypothetical protein